MIDTAVSYMHWRPLLFSACGLIMLSSCGIDKEGVNPALSASQFLAAVQLEHHTYNLATVDPYNTVQLHVAGLSGAGDILDKPVEYSVADSTVLTVSVTGLLKALTPVASTVVRASMTLNGITRTDSAFVSVVGGTPTQFLARLAIEVPPDDSAKWSHNIGMGNKTLPLIRQDSDGGNLSSLLVSLWSSDAGKAAITQSFNNVSIAAGRPGQVMLYVETYAYGVAMRDSLPFYIGWPTFGIVNVYAREQTGKTDPVMNFFPGRLIVGVGACILWSSNDVIDTDVVFENPSVVGPPTGPVCMLYGQQDMTGGNIAPFRMIPDANDLAGVFAKFRGRTFSIPGVYNYRSTLNGTSGTIVVCSSDDNTDACSPDNFTKNN